MDTQADSNHHAHASERSLWFGVSAGAAAWAIHGLTCVMISSQACQNGTGAWGPLSEGDVRLLLGGITLGFLGVAFAGFASSYRNWRRLSVERKLVHAEARGREQFMAFIGMVVGIVFIVGICWAGLPLALLNVCVKMR